MRGVGLLRRGVDDRDGVVKEDERDVNGHCMAFWESPH
jgi:hypothetical protein